MKQVTTKAVAVASLLAIALLYSQVAGAREWKGPQTGMAACYSKRLAGHRTTSGQRYDPSALTAAHGRIPAGTHVKVTNLANRKSVELVVNDRMAAHGKIVMDISEEACKELDFPSGGEAKVKIEALPAPGVAEH